MAGIEPRLLGTASQPLADTEHDYTVPGNGPLKILSVAVELQNDAGVADRDVEITFETSGGVIFYRVKTTAVMAASLLAQLVVASGISNEDVGAYRYMKLPDDFIVPTGTVIKTITALMETGDRYGALSVFGYSDGRWSV